MDSSLIANEIIEKGHRKGNKGVVVKLDNEKASDKVIWDFLDEMLKVKGFGLEVVFHLQASQLLSMVSWEESLELHRVLDKETHCLPSSLLL